jgi:solute carrier family 25 folate transporter 32
MIFMNKGMYFFIYNGLKENHMKKHVLDSGELTVVDFTLYATISSVTTICLTNPLFLIKTRMCLQYGQDNLETKKVVKYKNSLDAIYNLLKTDGFLGLYKGLIPGLFGTLNGTIQMVCYEKMKSFWLKRLQKRAEAMHIDEAPKQDTMHFSLFSSSSKLIAVICTYPFQLVRARLQDQHQNYRGLTDVIRKTYTNERLYGFYKGLIPALVRVVPAASVTFIVYENLLKFLSKH